MEKVVELLARKYPQFNTAISNCLVSDALYQMCCENVDYLIVMDDGKFKGIITDHDIASKILFESRPLNKIQVKEFMNASLPVATPDASLQSCMQMMERFNARHIVVYDRFEFKGVVSSYELMQEALNRPDSFFVETEPPRRGYPWNY
jgi:signal-transduction protein with cAMP-binding, CBS, and nucleotidyltransferase domain